MIVFKGSRAVALVLSLSAVGCGRATPNTVSSIAQPGNPVISFPNSPDRVNTTVLLSKPAAEVAGVDGRTLTITSVTFEKPEDKLTVDAVGNMGLHGSYHSQSSRADKKDIHPYNVDALALLDEARIVTFRYRDESSSAPSHVGLIADDTPQPLTDADKKSFDLNNSLAVTMAATQQQNVRVRSLERRILSLERALREITAKQTGTLVHSGNAAVRQVPAPGV